jgi:hypothetical protein
MISMKLVVVNNKKGSSYESNFKLLSCDTINQKLWGRRWNIGLCITDRVATFLRHFQKTFVKWLRRGIDLRLVIEDQVFNLSCSYLARNLIPAMRLRKNLSTVIQSRRRKDVSSWHLNGEPSGKFYRSLVTTLGIWIPFNFYVNVFLAIKTWTIFFYSVLHIVPANFAGSCV